MTRAREHIRNIQWAFRFGEDGYRDYAWEVRSALEGWRNEARLARYRYAKLVADRLG